MEKVTTAYIEAYNNGHGVFLVPDYDHGDNHTYLMEHCIDAAKHSEGSLGPRNSKAGIGRLETILYAHGITKVIYS